MLDMIDPFDDYDGASGAPLDAPSPSVWSVPPPADESTKELLANADRMTREEFDARHPTVDPTTEAANPAHYQRFSNGAQPAFIAEHLSWNAGQALRYLARGGTKPEIGLTDDQAYLQNLKKALWHVKREIMLVGGDPNDVSVPHPLDSV